MQTLMSTPTSQIESVQPSRAGVGSTRIVGNEKRGSWGWRLLSDLTVDSRQANRAGDPREKEKNPLPFTLISRIKDQSLGLIICFVSS